MKLVNKCKKSWNYKNNNKHKPAAKLEKISIIIVLVQAVLVAHLVVIVIVNIEKIVDLGVKANKNNSNKSSNNNKFNNKLSQMWWDKKKKINKTN